MNRRDADYPGGFPGDMDARDFLGPEPHRPGVERPERSERPGVPWCDPVERAAALARVVRWVEEKFRAPVDTTSTARLQ